MVDTISAAGIIIRDASVQQRGKEREIDLHISMDDLLSYQQVRERSVPQSVAWVEEQRQRACNGRDYELASRYNPLTGFGVGSLLCWNGKYLLGGRNKSS